MLMPKKVKYRKQQRGRMKGKAWARVEPGVRKLRTEDARRGMDHGSSDRGRTYCDDAFR